MTAVVLVDWLGRGGIAQTTEVWNVELEGSGIPCVIASRRGRELRASQPIKRQPSRSRLVQHAQVVHDATRLIAERRPSTVIIQNHVLPPLEAAVDRAARRYGARVVRVVHDHVLHSRAAGTQIGLASALREADVVVAHSDFVAESLRRRLDRSIEVLPLPVYLGMRADPSQLPEELVGVQPLAMQFGVVHRGYKGTDVTRALAATGVSPWRFAIMGAGAGGGEGLVTIDRYVDSAGFAAAVAASSVSLFPYRSATQSGGVSLAQSLGSVVVATAVGGLPEQVSDGVTGRLVTPNAPTRAWRAVLEELSDPEVRARMADAARLKVLADHEQFRRGAIRIARGGSA